MELQSFISRLESHFATSQITDIDTFCQEVAQIHDGYKNLPRAQVGMEKLVVLKFKLMHWRQKVLWLILRFLASCDIAKEAKRALEALSALELKPSPADLKTIAKHLKKHADQELKKAGAEYFARLGEHKFIAAVDPTPKDELLRIAGPRRRLPIKPNLPSRCTFKKWSADPEFSFYAFRDKGVYYRGIHFLPGDLIICNINRDGNGVYTVLNEPRGYAYHLGVFAIVEQGGRSIPVVIESYMLGCRSLPLSEFLSLKQNSYLEVYRLKNAPADFHAKANRFAAIAPQEVKGYNFDTEDPDRDYLACTSTASALFEKTGMPLIKAKSHYTKHPVVRRTIELVGLDLPAFLGPGDFTVDESLKLVGVVDNDHFYNNLARELMERNFLKMLQKWAFARHKFPLMSVANRFALRQVKARTFIGKIIGLFTGFNHINLPKGPELLLSIIEIYEHRMASAAVGLIPSLRKWIDHSKPVDVTQWAADPAIEKLVFEKLATVRATCELVEDIDAATVGSPAETSADTV